MPKYNKEGLPKILLNHFKKVDFIIHAGDMVGVTALKELEALNLPIIGVYGNHDYESVKKRYSYRAIVEIAGWRIGVTHGHLGDAERTKDRAWEMFREEEPDVIVYGHRHEAQMERKKNTLMFNPGSCIDSRQSYLSFGILQLGKKAVSGNFIQWKA
jgi:putative phosphoesterase